MMDGNYYRWTHKNCVDSQSITRFGRTSQGSTKYQGLITSYHVTLESIAKYSKISEGVTRHHMVSK